MEKTAVEWLVYQLNKDGFAKVVTDEEINKAKEMEKQQIIDAHKDGHESTYVGCDSGCNSTYYIDGSHEQYYNERYGSK